MLREFIRCNSLEERIQLIENSVPEEWNESELNTVCDIVGISERTAQMDAEEKLEVIRAVLGEKLDENIEDATVFKEPLEESEEE